MLDTAYSGERVFAPHDIAVYPIPSPSAVPAGMGYVVLARSMRSIAEDVARRHRISVDDLRSNEPGSRRRLYSWPRQEWTYLCRLEKNPDGKHRFSYPQLGRWCGGRDHTTMFHADRAHWRRLRDAQIESIRLANEEAALIHGAV